MLRNKRSHRSEKLKYHPLESSPHSLQLEKSLHSSEDHSQPKKKKENHEQDGYIALNLDHGFKLKVLPEEANRKNLDMIIAGDYWELKTINGGGGALPNRIDDGVFKWLDKRLIEAVPNLGTPKIVIDNRFSTCTDEHAISVIKYKMNQYRELGYDNTILITSDNKCVYVIRDGEELKVL